MPTVGRNMDNQDSANNVVFFISTGRCGTQFFAAKLTEHYKDLAVVEHEPFHLEYKPTYYFSAYHRNENVILSPAIQSHIDNIGETIANSHYIETGWPVYGLLPHMISCFKDRVKIVHLYRHPLPTAASLTTHNVYSRGEWSDVMSISPAQRGVVQGHLAGRTWDRMSEFEKCLFWWTEINHFAFHLHERFPSTPWLSLKFEDVFCGGDRSELVKLLDFLGLPERIEFANSIEEKTDRFSKKTSKDIDITSLTNYPMAKQIMAQLFYGFSKSVPQDINSRYKILPRDPWKYRVRRLCRRLYEEFSHLTRRST
jgi:hypothetical protein